MYYTASIDTTGVVGWIRKATMKTLRNQNDSELAQELYEVISQRKELDKREKELKAHFKAMGPDPIKVGGFLILQKDGSTTSLDRSMLAADHGEEFLARYLKETKYVKIEILRERAA